MKGKPKKIFKASPLLSGTNMTDWKSRRKARRKFFQDFAPASQHEDDETAKRETRKMASLKNFTASRLAVRHEHDESKKSKEHNVKKFSSRNWCVDDDF